VFSLLVTELSATNDILKDILDQIIGMRNDVYQLRQEYKAGRDEDKEHYEHFHSLDEQKNKISEAGMLAVIEYMQKANNMLGTGEKSFAMKMFNEAAREMQKQKVKVEQDEEYGEHKDEE